MVETRHIDAQRNAAITLHLGGDEKSTVRELLSTANSLYAITDTSVIRVQLADDIDPERTNSRTPNLSQQVLSAGYDNDVVARVLLTAKYLFGATKVSAATFVSDLIESCVVLTGQLIELDTIARNLSDDISRKKVALSETPQVRNSFALPSISGMDTKLHNILSMSDKAKDTMLAMCRLQFLPNATSKVKLGELEEAVTKAVHSEPSLQSVWQGTGEYFSLIRNLRNVSEHPKDGHRLVLSDFALQPDGRVDPPLVEIQHPETPIGTIPVAEFVEFVRNTMLDYAELMLTFIRLAGLLEHNPLGESVVEFPVEERPHKLVRYYPALNFDGRWCILN